MKIRRLSDAEFKVMKLIWGIAPPIKTNNIISELNSDHSTIEKEWSPSTIQTLITRLIEKGFIKAVKNGKDRIFTYTVSEDDYISYETKAFLKKYHNNSLDSFFAKLYSSDENSK